MSMLPNDTHRRLFAPGLALESGELLSPEYIAALKEDPDRRKRWLTGSWDLPDCGEAGHPEACGTASCLPSERTKAQRRRAVAPTAFEEIMDWADAYAQECRDLGHLEESKPRASLRRSLEDLLNKIDVKAEAGLCYFTLESAREFLKDIREIVATAQGKEYKR